MKPFGVKSMLIPMDATFYVHIEFKAKTGGWSVNLPFLCSKCGLCCTLDDFLTAGKLKSYPPNFQAHIRTHKLYEELGKRWAADPVKYDRYITQTPCPFLFDRICSIYEIRPEGCRQFPNTSFGMLTQNCESLNRFKRQLAVLKQGKSTKIFRHFVETPIISVQYTKKQYQRCLAKLCNAGMTEAELSLFCEFNKKTF